MTGRVRTVAGDVAAGDLGRVDYHEHLFQVTPLLPGDELDDESAAAAEAAELRESGFEAMIDATPLGLGRDVPALARVAAATGLRIVSATGAHRESHYRADHPLVALNEADLARRFTKDLRSRSGIVKAGIDYWKITRFSRRVLAAAASAHAEVSAPVMVHLEHGSAAHEVLDVLEADGVSADAVVLAHIDRNPDAVLHAELAARGAFLGYDGFARHREHPDSVVLDCLERAAHLGAENRLLVGGDVARRSRYRAYGGLPGLRYLGLRVVPRLIAMVGEDLSDRVLRRNPARLLARF
ncbi:aryldialkylphosphatase [Microbacterium paludicola]|uniref:Aryldialkylphosphatase n=2 Tax=Microbacterium paludicola TaxID=300019 RepID=A0A4Y9FXT8_9MICO|nr:aryldialkylphosphatase [Microbacterium paludicola]MBF0815954.1 aryldialkylphosphatase [Microbacterium paludicola]TFU33441.1 aryldialkylphosphatase [Microbacterium paludicola]